MEIIVYVHKHISRLKHLANNTLNDREHTQNKDN